MNQLRAESDELIELVQSGAARWLLALAAGYIRNARRGNGGPPALPRGTSELLVLLAKLDAGATELSVSGHPAGTLSDVSGMAPPREAASVARCHEKTARRRAAAGAVRSYRISERVLLVDVDGLVRDQQQRRKERR